MHLQLQKSEESFTHSPQAKLFLRLLSSPPPPPRRQSEIIHSPQAAFFKKSIPPSAGREGDN